MKNNLVAAAKLVKVIDLIAAKIYLQSGEHI